MQQFIYNKSKNKLDFKNEVKAIKSIHWGKIIYKVIIVSILLTLLVFFIMRLLFSINQGEVILNTFNVSMPFPIKVDNIFVIEKEKVDVNDTLFKYSMIDNDNSFSNDSEFWYMREDMEVNKNLRLLRIELQELESQVELERSYLLKVELMVEQSYARLADYDLQVMVVKRLEIRIARLKDEIAFYKQNYKGKLRAYSTALGAAENTNNYYLAPISGHVDRIFTYEKEYIQDQIIMNLINLEDVAIFGYILMKDVNLYRVGESVFLVFPDYSTTKGIIQRIYQSTALLPDGISEFDDTRYQVVKIVPKDEAEKEHWKYLNGANVKIIVNNIKNRVY